MKTIASLLERALQIVDEVGGGQSASAEDSDYAFATLQALLEELGKREIVYLYVDPTDRQAEDIPEHLWGPLSDALAADISTAFKGGMVSDAEREAKINRIRRVTYIGPSFEPVETTNF